MARSQLISLQSAAVVPSSGKRPRIVFRRSEHPPRKSVWKKACLCCRTTRMVRSGRTGVARAAVLAFHFQRPTLRLRACHHSHGTVHPAAGAGRNLEFWMDDAPPFNSLQF